jgi:hypothetical protein
LKKGRQHFCQARRERRKFNEVVMNYRRWYFGREKAGNKYFKLKDKKGQ